MREGTAMPEGGVSWRDGRVGGREGIFEQNGWTDGPGRTEKSKRREGVREGRLVQEEEGAR